MATAIGLARKGVRSPVLEISPQLGEIGAGIQLGPNAFHAFDYPGVDDAAREMAVYIDNLRLMAMEDAVCLSAKMEALPGDVERVLQNYQARRRLPTARIQLQSREIGEHVYHTDCAHFEPRNAVMSAKTPEEWYDLLDWLYGSIGLEGAVLGKAGSALIIYQEI